MKTNDDLSVLPDYKKKNILNNIGMAVAGLIAIIYLLNPDAGLIELIPDNIPIFGNLDEVAATILLLKVSRYFGWNPFHLFGKKKNKQAGGSLYGRRE